MDKRRNQSIQWFILGILLLGGMVLLIVGNVRYSRAYPGGRDFLIHWLGTRLFLAEGVSPYEKQASWRLNIAAYGTPDGIKGGEMYFISPLYSIVMYLPFAFFPTFELARGVWMAFLELGLIALVVACLKLTDWRMNLPALAIFFLFSLSWYHAVRPLIDGELAILVALLLVGSWLSIRAGADEMAGVLLAFATVKPLTVLLLLVYTLVWAITWRRWRILVWFFSTVFLLCASAALLMPDWILQAVRASLDFLQSGAALSFSSAIAGWFPAMGERIGRIIAGVLAGFLLIEWWLGRRAEFPAFLWTACFTLTVSSWIGLPTMPSNFIVLFPALVLTFATWERRWRRSGRPMTILSGVVLYGGLWAVAWPTLNTGYLSDQAPILFVILPGFLLIMLYWVRWWATQPPNVWFDLLVEENLRW